MNIEPTNLNDTTMPPELEEVDAPLPFEDFTAINLRDEDLNEEFNSLDGFREWQRDNQSSDTGLTFGDY